MTPETKNLGKRSVLADDFTTEAQRTPAPAVAGRDYGGQGRGGGGGMKETADYPDKHR